MSKLLALITLMLVACGNNPQPTPVLIPLSAPTATSPAISPFVDLIGESGDLVLGPVRCKDGSIKSVSVSWEKKRNKNDVPYIKLSDGQELYSQSVASVCDKLVGRLDMYEDGAKVQFFRYSLKDK